MRQLCPQTILVWLCLSPSPLFERCSSRLSDAAVFHYHYSLCSSPCAKGGHCRRGRGSCRASGSRGRGPVLPLSPRLQCLQCLQCLQWPFRMWTRRERGCVQSPDAARLARRAAVIRRQSPPEPAVCETRRKDAVRKGVSACVNIDLRALITLKR